MIIIILKILRLYHWRFIYDCLAITKDNRKNLAVKHLQFKLPP